MKSVFIREQKRYTFHELQFRFNLDKEPLQKLLQRLKSFGILKTVKNTKEQQELSDLFEEDAELNLRNFLRVGVSHSMSLLMSGL